MNLLTHPFFIHFSESSAKALAEYTEEFTLNDGTAIFQDGDPSEDVILVLDGKVDLIKKADGDRKITITSVEPGDYFGEWGVLDEQPRSTDAICVGITRVAKIPGPALLRILHQEPAYVTLQMLRTILKHLRRSNERFVEAMLKKP